MTHESGLLVHDPQTRLREEGSGLWEGIRPPHRKWTIVASECVPRQGMQEQPGADPSQPASGEVVQDDPAPGDPGHLADEGERLAGVEVMEDKGCMGDVEGAVLEWQPAAVGDAKRELVLGEERRPGARRGSQHLCPVVDPEDLESTTLAAPIGDEPNRDVCPAGPDIEHGHGLVRRQARPIEEGVERPSAQRDAPEEPVDPAEVSEVPFEGPGIGQVAVQMLSSADESLHPAIMPDSRERALARRAW